MKWTTEVPKKPGYYWVQIESVVSLPYTRVAEVFSNSKDGIANLFYIMGEHKTREIGTASGHILRFSDEPIYPPTEETKNV
jgi:hypothetical protein